jgi:hypothetical protein
MARKTSKFIRKRITQGRMEGGYVVFKPNAWLARIKFSRDYCDESICGETPSSEIADAAMDRANLALHKMINRAVLPEDVQPHDLLAHCIGVTQIRVLEMGGEGANDAMARLNQAATSLLRTRERWERTHQWGLDGLGITELRDAVAIYEVILRGSSPQLMENAQNLRLARVKQAQGVQA